MSINKSKFFQKLNLEIQAMEGIDGGIQPADPNMGMDQQPAADPNVGMDQPMTDPNAGMANVNTGTDQSMADPNAMSTPAADPNAGMSATDGTDPNAGAPPPPAIDPNAGMAATDGTVPTAIRKNNIIILSKFMNNKIMHRLAEDRSKDFSNYWNNNVLNNSTPFSFGDAVDSAGKALGGAINSIGDTLTGRTSDTDNNISQTNIKQDNKIMRRLADDGDFNFSGSTPFAGDSAENKSMYNGQYEIDNTQGLKNGDYVWGGDKTDSSEVALNSPPPPDAYDTLSQGKQDQYNGTREQNSPFRTDFAKIKNKFMKKLAEDEGLSDLIDVDNSTK